LQRWQYNPRTSSPSRSSLTVYLSPQSCSLMEAFLILPCLAFVERSKIQQSPFAPVRLCCPYLLTTPGSSATSRLSVHFVFQLIGLLFSAVSVRTRRTSPVDSASLYPCRRCYPPPPFPFSQFRNRILPSPGNYWLGQWNLAITSYFYVHVSYDLDSCSSSLRDFVDGFRRKRFPSPAIQATWLWLLP